MVLVASVVIFPETPAGPAPSKYSLSPQNSAPPTKIPPTLSLTYG